MLNIESMLLSFGGMSKGVEYIFLGVFCFVFAVTIIGVISISAANIFRHVKRAKISDVAEQMLTNFKEVSKDLKSDGKKTCPYCGVVNEKGKTKCSSCGAKLE